MQASIFTCNHCGAKLKVQAGPGQRVKCPKCGNISALAAAAAPTAQPSARSPATKATATKAMAVAARPAQAPPPAPEPDEPAFALEDIIGTEPSSDQAAEAPIEEAPRPARSGRGRGWPQKGAANQKKTWILIGGGSVAALLLIGLLLFFLLRGGSKPQKQPPIAAEPPAAPVAVAPQPPPAVPSQDWNLAYLPASPTAVLGVRPAAILNSQLTKDLLGTIDPLGVGRGEMQQAEQQLGVPFSALDQVVAAVIIKVGEQPSFDFVAVFRASTTIDRVKFIQYQGPGPATEVSFQGKTYHKVKAQSPPGLPGTPAGQTPPNPAVPAEGNQPPSGLPFGPGFAPPDEAVWFIDDRTVVVGTEPLVQAAITQGPTPPTLAPPFSESLSALGSSVQLALVIKLDVLKELVGKLPINIPGVAAGPGPLFPAGFDKVQVAGLSVNLSQQVELGLVGHCGGDSTAAAEVRSAIAGLIQQAQTEISAERKKVESQPGTPPGKAPPFQQQMRDAQLKIITALETMLKEVKNEVNGGRVLVRTSIPSATVSALLGLGMSMANTPAGPPAAPARSALPGYPGMPASGRPGQPGGPQPGAAGPQPGSAPK